MLNSISISRTFASCAPVIGPFISTYNAFEIKNDIKTLNAKYDKTTPLGSLQDMKQSLLTMSIAFAGLSGSQKTIDDVKRDVRKEQLEIESDRIKMISLPQKGVTYSKYGILSNLLTLATVVTSVALGILSLGNGTIILAGGAFQIFLHARNLRIYNEAVKESATLPSVGIKAGEPARI